jgi:hypothetical protein
MRSLLAIVALCAFVAVDAATDYQMGCIKKVRSMISEFVSVSQMKAVSFLSSNFWDAEIFWIWLSGRGPGLPDMLPF